MADGTIGSVRVASARGQHALLRFARAGGRTTLLRQHVPYPFHVTRPFYLDTPQRDLATIYLQSASGGIYAADDLSLTLDVAAGAAAHVTTQAATIVHDCRGASARMATQVSVGEDGFLALTPDPLVLFPGADIAFETEVTLHDTARAILVESACLHDPLGRERRFARFHSSLAVHDAHGAVRLSDRGGVDGESLGGPAVLGPWRAWATLLVVGPAGSLPDASLLEGYADHAGCLCCAGPAPSKLGLAVRLAGPDGGTLGRCLDGLFLVCTEALLGFVPARRRK